MPWMAVDDQMHGHRKFVKLGRDRMAATGLWATAGSWSAAGLTDGFVPDYIVQQWDPDLMIAARLCDVGLWSFVTDGDDKGYQFHDWQKCNPTREEVEQKREAERLRQRKSRERRRSSGGTDGPPEDPQGDRSQSRVTRDDVTRDNGVTHAGVPYVSQHPLPSPPLPSQERTSSSLTSSAAAPTDPDDTRRGGVEALFEPDPPTPNPVKAKAPRPERGTRIPDNFGAVGVTPDMVKWALVECPDVDGRFETAKFVDYWTAKTGQSATKRDWPATWRNWMRTAQERGGNFRSGGAVSIHSGSRQQPARQGTASARAQVFLDLAAEAERNSA